MIARLRALTAGGAGLRWAAFALILGASLWRLAGVDHLLVWHDEVFTLVRVLGYSQADITREVFAGQILTPADLLRYQQPDPLRGWGDSLQAMMGHPEHAPLYYLLGRVATMLPLDPLVAVRGVAALFGALLPVAAFWLMRELFGRGPMPWVAALLIALSPLHLLYAQEGRQYALWMLFSLLASALLVRALRRDRRADWWLYGVGLALGLYTHLLFVLLLPLHALFALLTAWRRGLPLAPLARAWLPPVGGALLSFAPWLLVLLLGAEEFDHFTAWMSRAVATERLFVAWGEHLVRGFVDPAPALPPALLPLLVPLGLALVYYLARAPRPAVWLLPLILLTYVGVVLGPDLLLGGSRSQHPRYALPAVLAAQLMVAWTLGDLLGRRPGGWTRRLAAAMLVLLLGAGALSCLAIQRADTWWTKNFSADNARVARLINAGAQPLILASGSGVSLGELISLAYHLDEDTRIWGEPLSDADSPAPPRLPAAPGERFALIPSNRLQAALAPDALEPLAGTWQWLRVVPRPVEQRSELPP